MADPSRNEVCSLLLSILHSSSDLQDSSTCCAAATSRKSLHEGALRNDVSTEAEEDDFDESNCRICLDPAQIGGTDVNPLLTLGCHCRGDLTHAHKQCLEVWFASRRLISPPDLISRPLKECEICRGDLSTAIVMLVDNYAIARGSSSQYQDGSVLTYAHLRLQAYWMGEEYPQRIVETVFGAAGIAIILVVYVYVELWCNF